MTHLSVKALRHYHQVGLLEPARVDPQTGYRSYDTEQVPLAQVIRRFRDLDMPVDQVKEVLASPDVAGRNAVISEHLAQLSARLDQTRAAVASLRDLLEHPDTHPTIVHRSVPPIPAVAISQEVGTGELGSWWTGAFEELREYVTSCHLRPASWSGGVYAAALFEQERGDALVFIPVSGVAEGVGRVRPCTIPAAELAIAVHRGSHGDIDRTYGALGTYVAQRALGVEGPVREHYLVSGLETSDESKWQTEIGFPIFQT
jgi:DNA-binding transcriptional MerR regulator